MSAPRLVRVPASRWERWQQTFADRHGALELLVEDGALVGRASDGSGFRARPPFGRVVPEPRPGAAGQSGQSGPPRLADLLEPPPRWAVLLARKGGFAVARLAGGHLEDSKTGRRHVQGRTKAGGQSQQRFARRRANQARAAHEAAATHADRIVADVPLLVVGGDRTAVETVLDLLDLDRRGTVVVGPWLDVPDPRRDVLEAAVVEAGAVVVEVDDVLRDRSG